MENIQILCIFCCFFDCFFKRYFLFAFGILITAYCFLTSSIFFSDVTARRIRRHYEQDVRGDSHSRYEIVRWPTLAVG